MESNVVYNYTNTQVYYHALAKLSNKNIFQDPDLSWDETDLPSRCIQVKNKRNDLKNNRNNSYDFKTNNNVEIGD